MKNWSVTNIYCDEGISGSTVDNRPDAMQMLDDAKNGLFENILIVKVDRLCRNTRDLLTIVDKLKRWNVRLNAVDEQIDPTTPVGKMMLTMLGSFAELERATITERMMAGKEQKTKQGYYNLGSQRPYGYDFIKTHSNENSRKKIVRVVQNPSEALMIKQWVQWIKEGKSMRWITNEMIKLDLPTSTGSKSWGTSLVSQILHNPNLRGYSRLKKSDGTVLLVKAVNIEKPILTEREYEELQTVLSSRKTYGKRKFAKSDFYFADVLYCSVCGHSMCTKNEKYTYRGTGKIYQSYYYRCNYRYRSHNNNQKECNAKAINQDKIEKSFLNFFEKIALPEPVTPDASDENKAIADNIAELDKVLDKNRQRKKRLLNLFIDNAISNDDYTGALSDINAETDQILNAIEKLEKEKKANTTIDIDLYKKNIRCFQKSKQFMEPNVQR